MLESCIYFKCEKILLTLFLEKKNIFYYDQLHIGLKIKLQKL